MPCFARERLLLLAAGAIATAHCGSRSDLRLPDAAPETATSSSGAGPGGAGASAPVEPACALVSAGDPLEIIAPNGRHAQSPRMVVVEPGNPEEGRFARVAVNAFAGGGEGLEHPDVQLAGLRFGARWPDDVTVEHSPAIFGVESHSWAEMATAPGGISQLAIAWYSDPGQVGRVAFRTLTTDSWTPGPIVDVSFDAEVALALAPGAGVGPFGVGYAGDGYAIALRHVEDSGGNAVARSEVAILDPAGALLLGPHSQGIEGSYPGHAPSIVWSGQSYLIATAYPNCRSMPDCVAPLTVERIRPATGDAFDDSGIDFVWGHDPEARPRRPSLDSLEGRTWMAWAQGDREGPLALRLLELRPMGEMLSGRPVPVADELHIESRVELRAARFGLVLVHAEDGDPRLSDQALGRSRIVARHLDHHGAALGTISIDATRFNDYGPPIAVPLAHPRGVALAWSGRSTTSGFEVTYLALLRCGS